MVEKILGVGGGCRASPRRPRWMDIPGGNPETFPDEQKNLSKAGVIFDLSHQPEALIQPKVVNSLAPAGVA